MSRSFFDQQPKLDFTLILSIRGKPGSGKTSLLKSFVDGTFEDKLEFAPDFQYKTIDCLGKKVKLQIFDTDAEKTLRSNYERSTYGYIVVVDLTEPSSLDTALNRINEIKRYNENASIILACTKADLTDKVKFTHEDVVEFLQSKNINTPVIITTSSKENSKVDDVFMQLTEDILIKKGLVEVKERTNTNSPL
ncbi:Rab family GTPase [Legionella waltersii]|uniref:Ras family protein n=1 Tax=Legionella waltersii TaxID=66969 RepID=A0A0W1ANY7_9GAMM|nr:Rab family GTPase [Legionella waltersii]KTD82962.1 Ras family protein [Legionella waltersii]SNU97296.1 small GTP-binding protein domain [Legionella waltersii]